MSIDIRSQSELGRFKVYVDPSGETVKNGPEYRPEALNRTYEEMLYNYYKRPKYWDR